MINIDSAAIRELVCHRTSGEDQGSEPGDSMQGFGTDEEEVLKKIFLKPFLSNITTWEFGHEIDLELNPLFKLSESINEGGDFVTISGKICQHLDAVSKHPNIKEGDLFIMDIDGIVFDGNTYSALGIFKAENKENFIETGSGPGGRTSITFRKGIGSRKLDKACLILFTERPYTVFIIDTTGNEADYWKNDFVKVNLKQDAINSTGQFLSIAKSFATKQLPAEFEISKADQIDLLKRSVEYFRQHDSFEKQGFEQEVLQDQEVIKSFQNFDSRYRQEKDLLIADEFEISPQVVKQQAKNFKSVLKLDRNFHIYIHGNRELIKQGVDSDGRKFYKIYFENES